MLIYDSIFYCDTNYWHTDYANCLGSLKALQIKLCQKKVRTWPDLGHSHLSFNKSMNAAKQEVGCFNRYCRVFIQSPLSVISREVECWGVKRGRTVGQKRKNQKKSQPIMLSGFTWPRAKGRNHSQYTDVTEVGHPWHTVLGWERKGDDIGMTRIMLSENH